MNPTQVAESGAALPPEVVAFAAQHGVADSLYPILEMTKRLFPSARGFSVFLEDDPEIADLKFIVFEVKAPGLEIPEATQRKRTWSRELDKYYRATPGCAIVLGLN